MKQSGPKTGDQDHENHTKTAAKGPKSLRKVLLAIITFSISSDYIGRITEHRTHFFSMPNTFWLSKLQMKVASITLNFESFKLQDSVKDSDRPNYTVPGDQHLISNKIHRFSSSNTFLFYTLLTSVAVLYVTIYTSVASEVVTY